MAAPMVKVDNAILVWKTRLFPFLLCGLRHLGQSWMLIESFAILSTKFLILEHFPKIDETYQHGDDGKEIY
jgi:hypothetical protein